MKEKKISRRALIYREFLVSNSLGSKEVAGAVFGCKEKFIDNSESEIGSSLK